MSKSSRAEDTLAKRLRFGPSIYWGISVVALYFMWRFWRGAQQGDDLHAVASVGLFAVGIRYIFVGFTSWDQHRAEAATEEALLNCKDTQGQARWAREKDVARAGMLEQTGPYLGKLGRKDLHYPGETHLLTVAPPGAGKGACAVIPTLLKYKKSIVVTDPKGELYAVTSKHRRDVLGNKIIVLCPWAEKMGEELEMAIPDHGFNPLSILTPGPDIKDECELISSLLLPRSAKLKPEDDFWIDGGQSILTAFLLHMVSRSEQFGPVTLPLLRRQLMQPPDQLTGILSDMAENDDFEGCIREYGGKLLGTCERAPKQFEGMLGNAQRALRIYDSISPLGKHVAEGEIDFKSLKDTPTTIYLIMPSDRSVTHAAWLNMVISLAIELVGRDRSNQRVLFLLDEMANMGYMPNILKGMAQYRGQGLQVWSIIQQISQLEQLYGKEGLEQFIGMCELVNVFGVWDPQTIEFMSKWIGQETIRDITLSVTNPKSSLEHAAVSTSAKDLGRALMRPEDIRTMSSDEQLIFYRNLHPIKARKTPYFDDRKMNKWAAPNPYRRKMKKR